VLSLCLTIGLAAALTPAATAGTGGDAGATSSPAPLRPLKQRGDLFGERSTAAATRAAAGAELLPAGFQESVVIDGLTEPMAVSFASDGRVFVAEKSGLIKVFDDLSDPSPSVFADLSTNVYNFFDRGLMSIALDPNFPANPYVYALYTYDGDVGGPAPKWGQVGVLSDQCPSPPGATANGCVASGRLVRMQAIGNQAGPEQLLVQGWCQQFPSHSLGDIAFGPEGALYATGGDAASFAYADYGQSGIPPNPCGDPPVGVGGTQTPPTAEGGALRSQDLRTSGDPADLDGALIRVDPATGAPFAGNPNVGNPDTNVARILAYGLRNTFRFAFRPGTDDLWLGDVGWRNYEEIDVLTSPAAPVENYGWPCYEGTRRQAGYDGLNLTICEDLYAQGGHVEPVFNYRRGSAIDPDDGCAAGSSSISAMEFYAGGSYPSEYDNALFFGDYTRGCIWVMFPGSGGAPDPATVQGFVSPAQFPVDLEVGPGGDLFYVDIVSGSIWRISYFAGNQPPTAVATASPTFGALPLTVNFDGTGSSDPDDDPLTYAWDLDGDGQFDDSTSPTPSHVYTQAGTIDVGLRVTDPSDDSGTDTVVVSPGESPPTASIDAPEPGFLWNVGDVVNFAGSAFDTQDGALGAAQLSWSLTLQHCPSTCHAHPLQDFVGTAGGSFVAPDHEYPSWLELTLTATDSVGLQDVETLRLDPRTVQLTFQTSPSGLQLAIGGVTRNTPASITVAVGSTNSVSAPTPQTLSGTSYSFASWSDGGAQSHNIVAPASPTTYTATYQPLTGTTNVTVTDTGITPSRLDVNPGATILWTNAGSNAHRIADSSGMGLFDSGTIPPGGSYAFTFVGAGTYTYSEPGNPQLTASLGVGMQTSPTSGSPTTQFTITWASAAPPAGYVWDVQIRRPSQGWVAWRTGVTSLSDVFTPDGGTGNYQFRARFRNTANGAASAYSRAARVRVR
jgi:glucose/arabinose dehydrogenase/plastocyanin